MEEFTNAWQSDRVLSSCGFTALVVYVILSRVLDA